ncbi:MAG: helix-turn-helix transcriptional regulator [Leptospiraceae bacterium]|nr:helix-turn-helix transcriptional regulator [Leptospiraceae bacterium]
MSRGSETSLWVGARIKLLRKKAGLTQEKLAELSGIDYKHIQLLEGKNPTDLRVDNLKKICDALDVSLSEFFERF